MSSIEIRDAKSGDKTLVIVSDKEYRLHSIYNPREEATKQVDLFKKGRASIILLCGLGFGYQLDELKKRFPDCTIITIEENREIIDIVKLHRPDTLKGIWIANNTEEIYSLLDHCDITSFKGVARFINRPSYQLNPQYYDNLTTELQKGISSRMSDLLTRFEFEERWIKNILNNMKHIDRAVPIKELFGHFKGIPGVIVSAGPSLRDNLPYLAELKDKAVIVAVDTAYKVLLKYGIEPHIVMALDAQKYTYKHFTGTNSQSTVLLADVVCCPRAIDDFPGRLLYSTTSKYYEDASGQMQRETTAVISWLEKFIKPFGDIQSGGSVATSVFDLLLNLGCNQIILVGQDLAYTGREIHCSGTYHNDDWLPLTNRFKNLDTINQLVIRRRKIKYVPAAGNNPDVITDFVFDLYKSWFEDSAKRVKIPVINAGSHGAKIANTVEMDLSLLTEKLPVLKSSPQMIIKTILQDYSSSQTKVLCNKFSEAIILLEKLIEDIQKSRENDLPAIPAFIEDLIFPLLRKTIFYLERHPDLDELKKNELFRNTLLNQSGKILDYLKKHVPC